MTIRKRQGYTLIEVLMAIVILAFVLPGVVIMVVNSRKVQNQSLRFEAGAAAAQRIFDTLAIRTRVAGIAQTSGSLVVQEAGVPYTVNWNLQPYTTGGATPAPVGGQLLVADVEWKTNGGRTSHSTTLRGVVP